MMQMQLAVFSILDDRLLADWSSRVISCSVHSNVHGYASCEAEIDVPFYEAFTYYQQSGPLRLKVSWGSYRVWEGRLDDPNQFTRNDGSGLRIVAFGGWVAYNDAPYTAFWSMHTFNPFLETTEIHSAAYSEATRWGRDTNKRLYIELIKGNAYTLNKASGLLFYTPHLSTRSIIAIQFEIALLLPTQVTWRCVGFDEALPLASGVVHTSIVGSGALINRAFLINASASPRDVVAFDLLCNTAFTNATETGAYYVNITKLRIVSALTNLIATTFTANRNAGASVTATVGSTARMYAGMELVLNNSGNPSEIITVISVTNGTQFVATFVSNYVIGQTLESVAIYPDEVIKDCITELNALNPTQVSANVDLIQSQTIDLDQAIYEDQYPADIINELLTKGDTLGQQWIAQVYDNQQLIVRPRGGGRAWYAEITSLDVVRTLSELYNSVYAVYTNAVDDRKLRTNTSSDTASVARFGLVRRKAIPVETTSNAQAENVRTTVLTAQADPIPRASVTFDRIFDDGGRSHPLAFVRNDDTLTLRNLPQVLGTVYDKIRTLVITKTDYDVVNDRLTLDLEIPQPQIEVLIAQALKEGR